MLPVRRKLLTFALAFLATCAFVTAADAGWVTFKNDTKNPVVVQQVMTLPNGKQARGVPRKLAAGESFREFQNVPGVNAYEVYNTGNPPAKVWSGTLNCKADAQSFSVLTVCGKTGVVQVPEKE
jgi:type IV pilus biogenesis protein CpaD/CtpE